MMVRRAEPRGGASFASDVAFFDAERSDDELSEELDRLRRSLFIALGGLPGILMLALTLSFTTAAWIAVSALGPQLHSGLFWIPAVTIANVLSLMTGGQTYMIASEYARLRRIRAVMREVARLRREGA
jgi:hypothetical protein